MKVLITGGAGFIGQNLTRRLLLEGADVRIIDNFNPQVHSKPDLPNYLKSEVELINADVRDRAAIRDALVGVDRIIHLAAETGTGQSMYEIDRYFSVNVQGTATLLDLLQNDDCGQHVKSLVVASSRAIYGEGAYFCPSHAIVYPKQRIKDKLLMGQFEPSCPYCESPLSLLATTEAAPFNPMSFYGLTKQIQEQSVLMFAKTKGINGIALRYQNVYGPGQSLKNPYTGILAVFSNLARQKRAIEIYEDGNESRDFVYVDDVVNATLKAIQYNNDLVGAFNIGSGQATTVMSVAQQINKFFNNETEIRFTGAFRLGDIRHNIADISLSKDILSYEPIVGFEKGMSNFLNWASSQALEDPEAYARSSAELASKGLMNTLIEG